MQIQTLYFKQTKVQAEKKESLHCLYVSDNILGKTISNVYTNQCNTC